MCVSVCVQCVQCGALRCGQCVYLHGVVGVLVVEDEGLLAQLVVALQLVDVALVVDDVLLVLFQVVHLLLQGAGDVHGHVTDLLVAEQEQGREGKHSGRT